MKTRLHWNKWGFLPPLLLLIGSVLLLLNMGGGGDWPLHFDLAGRPNRYGSSAELWGMITCQFFLILAMACLDEGTITLRNWKYNIGSACAAFISGSFFGALLMIYRSGRYQREQPGMIAWILALSLLAPLVSWLLESRRTFPEGANEQPQPESAAAVAAASTATPVHFHEHLNPWWMNGMLFFTMLGIVSVALFLPPAAPVLWLLILPTAIMAPFLGGFHLSLDEQRLAVHIGWLRIRCLRVPVTTMRAVSVLAINPIREYGGWGIRYSLKRGWGFILGNRGVCITKARGRAIVISSERPEELAACCRRLLLPPTAP